MRSSPVSVVGVRPGHVVLACARCGVRREHATDTAPGVDRVAQFIADHDPARDGSGCPGVRPVSNPARVRVH